MRHLRNAEDDRFDFVVELEGRLAEAPSPRKGGPLLVEAALKSWERAIGVLYRKHHSFDGLLAMVQEVLFNRAISKFDCQAGQRTHMPNAPETFDEAQSWAGAREAETGEMPKSVSNPVKGLFFDLENSTVTRSVWDQDDNLIEMTYCAVTGDVLTKKVTRPSR